MVVVFSPPDNLRIRPFLGIAGNYTIATPEELASDDTVVPTVDSVIEEAMRGLSSKEHTKREGTFIPITVLFVCKAITCHRQGVWARLELGVMRGGGIERDNTIPARDVSNMIGGLAQLTLWHGPAQLQIPDGRSLGNVL